VVPAGVLRPTVLLIPQGSWPPPTMNLWMRDRETKRENEVRRVIQGTMRRDEEAMEMEMEMEMER